MRRRRRRAVPTLPNLVGADVRPGRRRQQFAKEIARRGGDLIDG
jgi:hypothetical protein